MTVPQSKPKKKRDRSNDPKPWIAVVTNTTEHDTLTLGEFKRLRAEADAEKEREDDGSCSTEQ